MFHSFVSLALSLLLVLNSIAVAAVPEDSNAANPPTYEDVTRQLDAFMQFLDSLRSQVDRSQFDLGALLEELEFEAENISRFVTDNIYFEQYPGVLRGAQGALMSRAGNSLDQALLLATLLKDAGYEARINRATVSRQEAVTLLEQMLTTRPPRPYPLRTDQLQPLLANLAKQFGISDEIFESLKPKREEIDALPEIPPIDSTEYFLNSQAEADELIAVLRAANVPIERSELDKEIIQEARDYFWVQWKSGPVEPWENVHPAFGNAIPADFQPAVSETFADEIPAQFHHRLRLEVSIDQDFNGNRISHQLMTPWERPVANMIGKPITYLNLPDLLQTQSGFDRLDESISESSYFIPLFNGSLPEGAQAFDLDGNVISPDMLQQGYAGVFRQVFSKGEAASSEISQLGSESDEPSKIDLVSLAAHYIDYVFVHPNGRETRVRRTIFDQQIAPPGAPADSESSAASVSPAVKFSLSEHQNFMIAVGGYPPAFVLDSMLAGLVTSKSAFQLAVDMAFHPEKEHDPNVMSGSSFFNGPQLELFSYFDQSFDDKKQARSYRASPSLIAFRQELRIGPGVRGVIDIIKNDRRSFATSGEALVSAPDISLRAGVWETWMERQSQSERPGSKIVQSTANLVNRAKEFSIPLKVIGPGDSARLSKLELPVDSLQAIRGDLHRGYYVIVPERPLLDAKGSGLWYRVNPDTGETLGMTGNGIGATVAEYIVLIVAAVVGVWVGYRVFLDCVGGSVPTGSQLRSNPGKGIGCAFCALVAQITATIIVATVGLFAVQNFAMATAPSFMTGPGAFVHRLTVMAERMKFHEVAGQLAVTALVRVIVDYLCTEVDLADW